ncbi:RDD family protein [Candidatus Gottesmanbacteria bacterium]|nr:RDD family protein [Candidatus Gottesmanbacteria bacterium]
MGKKLIAGFLDFLIAFIGIGWLLTRISGREGTVSLYDIWLLIWVGSVVAYFLLTKKYLGQTLGSKIMGIPVKKK